MTRRQGLQQLLLEVIQTEVAPGGLFTFEQACWWGNQWERASVSSALSEFVKRGLVSRASKGVFQRSRSGGDLVVQDIVQMQEGTILVIINGKMYRCEPI